MAQLFFTAFRVKISADFALFAEIRLQQCTSLGAGIDGKIGSRIWDNLGCLAANNFRK